ncbi:hypothetical protein G6K92_33330, partial [Agrobacterium rhizogenes]|nr:hypothetical protein [Rhizobium rhizogenes]NTH68911.1 hypothetical protein [Rhizobium rhizogenes]NTI00370.1 hypothetical protein [Rhizobium rhizogenes]
IELIARWSWDEAYFSGEQISWLANAWFSCLQAMVSHSERFAPSNLNPSDFPLVEISQLDITELEASFESQD